VFSTHRFRIAGKSWEVDDAWKLYTGSPELNLEKLAWCREPLAAGDWDHFIGRHPRPLRLECFREIAGRLTDAEYWRLLAGIWTDAEVPNVNRAIWIDLFTADRGGREDVMKPEEHAAFAALSEPVQIYRGAPMKYARGMAWTTDRDRAMWFAERYAYTNGARLLTAILPKRKLLAYFTERKEAEAVIDPRRIKYEVLKSEKAESGVN
jgi:hypothetical protein